MEELSLQEHINRIKNLDNLPKIKQVKSRVRKYTTPDFSKMDIIQIRYVPYNRQFFYKSYHLMKNEILNLILSKKPITFVEKKQDVTEKIYLKLLPELLEKTTGNLDIYKQLISKVVLQ